MAHLYTRLSTIVSATGLLAATVIAQPGSNDPTFNPDDVGGGNGDGFYPYDAFASLIQPDGKIILSGEFITYNGSGPSYFVRLNPNGSRDETFQMGSGPDFVGAMAAAPNGQILLASVSSYDGIPIPNRIARINADGSFDPSFQASLGPDRSVGLVAVQPDGKVVVGGWENVGQDSSVGWVGRLNTDGSLDNSFAIANAFDTAEANGIRRLALTSDGKVMVLGYFNRFGGVECHNILRLNADGTRDASFEADAAFGGDPIDMALRPDDKVLVGGWSLLNSEGHNALVQLNVDGSVDETFDIGTGFALPSELSSDPSVTSLLIQPDGKVVVGGRFEELNGEAYVGLVRLNADGSTDATFDTGLGCQGYIYTMSLDQNGSIMVAGGFQEYDGFGLASIARIEPDGSLDPTFNPGSGFYIASHGIFDEGPLVSELAVEADGDFYAGGLFHGYNGVPRNRIVHVLADGAVDTAFDPGQGFRNDNEDGYPPTSITALLTQEDGKVIIAGAFNSYNGQPCGMISRLNPDATLDASFNGGSGPVGSWVEDMAWAPDGKLFVSGYFSSYNGSAYPGIVRLNPDGTLDTGFGPVNGFVAGPLAVQPDGRVFVGTSRLLPDGTPDETWYTEGVNGGQVNCTALQPDGRLLIGGSFTHVGDVARNGIARLNSDGSLDAGFDPGSGMGGGIPEVLTMSLQGDGRVIIGGRFTEVNGTPRQHIARLESTGSLDTSFDPGSGFDGLELGYYTDGWVYSLAQQPGNKLIVGGAFTSFNGVGRNRIARLLLGNPVDCLGVENGPALPGTSCDDGVATTGNDVYGPDCVCAGLLIDCLGVPGGSQLPNTPCNDGDPQTGLDHYDEDCQCVGVPIDCEGIIGGSGLPGTACDDGLANTVNDTWTVDCDCVGELLDCLGVPGGTALPETPCDDGDVNTGNDAWTWDCVCSGEVIDCLGEPGGSALPGTACDDGNSATLNDVYTVDCICQGETNACIPSQLTTTADPVISCGAVNLKLDGTSTISATEVPGANKYQFRFTNTTGQPAYARNIAWPTRSFTLTKWYTSPLKAGRTYNVMVRASFDDGATWCDWGPSCTVRISWSPLAPGMVRDMAESLDVASELLVYPNPTNGDQLRIDLSGADPKLTTATLDLTDLFGKRVMTATLPLQFGELNTALSLGSELSVGVYFLTITAGEQVFNERVVITR